jgi:hypothetical protein
VTVFSSPAGGCLLTDPGFSARLRDLMGHDPDFTENDAELLKHGRHFRLSGSVKAIVGRDQEDNEHIEGLARAGDVLVEVAAGHSPTTLLRGEAGEDELRTAAELTARYSKSRDRDEVECEHWRPSEGGSRGSGQRLSVAPADEDALEQLAVGRVGD